MSKYVFVTGGVVSGLGKGITVASLGRLLKAKGYKVAAQKLDPYINVDPGTMSPYQHGEVFVTEDGAETDLDLGHYERFIDENTNKYSNLTTGKVYYNVIRKEREGAYLGGTVQVIPHITDEIKRFVYSVGQKSAADVVITEIGGTIGDIESQPFLEAVRQICFEKRGDSMLIHVTLVPFIDGSDEYKTKPTQHSVKQLQSMGLSPDIIVTRCRERLTREVKDKIAMFCNVERECVIDNVTVESLYEAPLMLEEEQLSAKVCKALGLEDRPCRLKVWEERVERIKNPGRGVGGFGNAEQGKRARAAERLRRSDRPRRLWFQRHRGHDSGGGILPDERSALFRHMPGHADGGHRIRAPRPGLGGRGFGRAEQHVRAQGDRSDGRPIRGYPQGRDHAPGRLSVRAGKGQPRRADIRP